MVKLVDIARAAGASTSKVSRALSGSAEVSRSETERITQIAAAMGWTQTNRFAKGIRTGRSFILGCLLNDFTNPYYSEIMVGIEQAALGRGYVVLFCDLSRSDALMGRLMEYQVDGLILTAMTDSEAMRVKAYVESGRPVVTTAEQHTPYATSGMVIPDYRAAAALLVSHLVELGHRRIAFFGDGMLDNSRLDGYRLGLEQNGIAFEPSLAPLVPMHGVSLEAGRRTAGQLLEMDGPPTAVIVHNDLKAVGMILELRERGLEVPGDFSICSFDGLEPGKWMTPPLTSIATNNELWGRLAAETLIAAVEGTPQKDSMVTWTFFKGGTVAPPRRTGIAYGPWSASRSSGAASE